MPRFCTTEQKAAALSAGLDKSPPRCATCRHAGKPTWPQPALRSGYLPPRCLIGGFPIKKYYVCDQWKSWNGETLETRASSSDSPITTASAD